MRRFDVVRMRDVSGVSGTGVIAEGCEFGNGRVAVAWLTPSGSMEFYDTILVFLNKHGHGGDTTVTWHDEPLSSLIARRRRERAK